MSDPSTILAKQEQLALVKATLASQGYQELILPELRTRAKHHALECRNKNLTPEQRAEHIEAADGFESMTTFLDVLSGSLERTINELKKKK